MIISLEGFSRASCSGIHKEIAESTNNKQKFCQHSDSFVTRAVLVWTLEKLDAGERVAIASVINAKGSVPGKPGARLAIGSSGSIFGTVGGAGLEMKVEKKLNEMLEIPPKELRKQGGYVETFQLYKDAKGEKATPLDSLCGGRLTVAFEVIEPVPHILIAGGGHVGRSIAISADLLGWAHSVFDVREEFSNTDRYPYATDNFSSQVNEFLENESKESLLRFSDILLLGHDWSVDQELLLGLLKIRGDSIRPRIGAIGSKSKWNAFLRAASGDGINDKFLENVRCPIGLNIGADSPEEIAIAVCAEILALERGME